ncbi:uncharacterized mitochondrial protein-like protein [Tanacetum coccineum]
MEILPESTSNNSAIGLDDGVAASFQRSQIHKPHAHTQAFKVNQLCLVVLTGTCPDFVTTAVGTKFLLGCRDITLLQNDEGPRSISLRASEPVGVTVDGESVDWTTHLENDENYAFMANNSSGSDTQERNQHDFEVTNMDNAQRVNKQNQFVPLAVQTRTGTNPVKASSTKNFSTARHSVNRQTVLTSTALKVNTVKPMMSDVRSANVFHKTNSPSSRPFKRTTVLKTNLSNQKVYTAKDNPHRNLQNKGIIDSGCSRHMTGNKAYLADFQDINGGPVAFGGSKGYITGKGKIKTGKLDFEDVSFVKELQPFQSLFRGNTAMPELYNKMELLRERTRPLLRQQDHGVQILFYLKLFGAEAVSYCLLLFLTKGPLGKFVGNSDGYFWLGILYKSKAFRVYNLVPNVLKEPSHKTLENKPNVAGKGPTWLFDLDYLTDSMNYHSVRSENQANLHAGQQESNQNTGTKDKIDAGDSEKEDESAQDCFELPIWHSYSSTNTSASKSDNKRGGPREEEQVFLDDLARLQRQEKEANEEAEALRKNLEQETENLVTQAGAAKSSSTNIFSTVSTTAKASGTNLVNTVSIPVSTASPNEGLSISDTTNSQEDDFEIPPLEDIHQDTTDGIFTHSSYDDEGAEADFTNLETVVSVSPIPTLRINPFHPSTLILDDIMFGSTKKSWCDEFEALMKSRFQMSSMGELTFFLGLQVKQKPYGIFISQDKYVAEILKKFDIASVKIAGTPIETQKPLVKDEEASDVDVHLYRSMIGSLMYVTASRPDIMFAVCACSRFQVTPKTSHLSAVKRIFRYLKGKPKLGLWYPRVSSFDLESYSDSDYAGFNFMNPKIYIDNESTICIVKNPVYHSKTKHIAIRHHFIRDAYKKKLIHVLNIYTNDNVADLLTKAFDVSRFQFLVVSIGMINP